MGLMIQDTEKRREKQWSGKGREAFAHLLWGNPFKPIYKNDIFSAIIIKERSDPRKAEGCV
jgi:hypothetical protein